MFHGKLYKQIPGWRNLARLMKNNKSPAVFLSLQLVQCIFQRRVTQQVSKYLHEAAAPSTVKHVDSGHSHIRYWNSPEFYVITSITDATPLRGGFLGFIQPEKYRTCQFDGEWIWVSESSKQTQNKNKTGQKRTRICHSRKPHWLKARGLKTLTSRKKIYMRSGRKVQTHPAWGKCSAVDRWRRVWSPFVGWRIGPPPGAPSWTPGSWGWKETSRIVLSENKRQRCVTLT